MPQKIPGVWGLAPNEAGKISDLPIDSFKDRRCYFCYGTRSVPATFATAHGEVVKKLKCPSAIGGLALELLL